MATRTKFARLSQYWCKFSKASHIFLKNGLWQMLASLASPAKLLGECWRVWRVRAARLDECWRVWQVLAKPLDECWCKQDRSFYAQITYFICIKWSRLHSLNSPNSPNLLNSSKTCQTCLSRVWRVQVKQVGECWGVWRVRATWLGECRQVWRVLAKPLGKCRRKRA